RPRAQTRQHPRVKLLFDENLSPVLPAALKDCYSESQHVRDAGLKTSPDAEVWMYAARHELAIVTKGCGLPVEELSPRLSAQGHVDRTGQLLDGGGRGPVASAGSRGHGVPGGQGESFPRAFLNIPQHCE